MGSNRRASALIIVLLVACSARCGGSSDDVAVLGVDAERDAGDVQVDSGQPSTPDPGASPDPDPGPPARTDILPPVDEGRDSGPDLSDEGLPDVLDAADVGDAELGEGLDAADASETDTGPDIPQRPPCDRECCHNLDCADGFFCCLEGSLSCTDFGQCVPAGCMPETRVHELVRGPGQLEVRFADVPIGCDNVAAADRYRVYVSEGTGGPLVLAETIESRAAVAFEPQITLVGGLRNRTLYGVEVRPMYGSVEGVAANVRYAMPAPDEVVITTHAVAGASANGAPRYDPVGDRLAFSSDGWLWVAERALESPEDARLSGCGLLARWRAATEGPPIELVFIGSSIPCEPSRDVIWLADWVDATQLIVASPTPSPVALDVSSDGTAVVWSDGGRVEIAAFEDAELSVPRLLRLPDGAARVHDVAFVPGSLNVLCTLGAAGDEGVARLSSDGETPGAVIYDGPGTERDPRLLPTGEHISFTSDQSGRDAVWIAHTGTMARAQITGSVVLDAAEAEWTSAGVWMSGRIDGEGPRVLAFIETPVLP